MSSLRKDSASGKIAIVGRPNVGKSTLFNLLTNTRSAIIKDRPGVTRDIQVGKCEWQNKTFEVMDTGGVTDSDEFLPKMIKEKVEEALKLCDAILFVVDGRDGLMPNDRSLLAMIKKVNKPYKILVNKVDQEHETELRLAEFYELSDDLYACSFEKRQGISDVLDWALEIFKGKTDDHLVSELTFTVVGKPNVGKSSLVNRLLGENRMIVSPMAGTTVDAIDSTFEKNGRFYTITDTAGLRRKSKRNDDIEILSSFKSLNAIERAHIVLLMVDVQEGPSEQDAKILREIQDNHKTVILVANKVDEAEDKKTPKIRETFKKKVKDVFHFYEDIPVVYTSAKTGYGIKSLFEKIDELWEKVNIKISTGELNRFFTKVIRLAPAPVYRSQNVKFYYLTQTNQKPPSFIAFANRPEGVDNAYRRFLMKNIKKEWNLQGVPVRIFAMKGRHSE